MKTRIIQDQPEPNGESAGGSSGSAGPEQHRHLVARIGRWSAQNRKKAILGWLAFVIVAFAVGNSVGTQSISSVDRFNGESHDAEEAADAAGLRPNQELVLVQSDELTVDDAAFGAAIDDVTSGLAPVAYVENVSSPLDEGGSVSADGHSALVGFEIAGDSTEAGDRVDPTLDAVDAAQAANPELTVEQFGDASGNKAIQDTIQSDLGKAGMLSLPITLIILTIAFGSLVAAGVPLLLGLSAVIGALGLSALASQVFPADDSVAAVILLIGLAVGVDYSLFYLRREREERGAGRDMHAALDIAGATSGRAVLVSGLTVIVAMAGMFISGDPSFISFAVGTILVVALAVVASVTVLPAAIAGLGPRLERGRIPGLRHRSEAKPSRLWTAIINRVTKRPILSLVLAGGALVALAVPALGMKTVVTGVDELDQSLPVIQTYNKVTEAFPSEGVTASVVVEADDVRSGPAADGIAGLVREVEASDTFPAAPEVDYGEGGTVAEIAIPSPGDGVNAASVAALDEVRDEIVPATLGTVEGVVANVTGDTASSVDSRNQLNERLPLIFAFVFGLAFVLMTVTFRSIVIPIKAILLNLLSVGAAYGVLVLVFQDGHGESLLGFTSNGGVTSWLPLFLFVILFGLSMDYHVFILSRVRELYDGGMSTSEAVRQAIATTAGTVTSAAVVMVGVFSVFATLEFIDFKELGVGLAVAVLIDATLIRGVLLPASMKLLGDWNWYLPKSLGWLPSLGGDIPHRAPEAKAEPARA
jgi:RND superfamily putative drug exporter